MARAKMALRLVMTKRDPRQSNFLVVPGEHPDAPPLYIYSSTTTRYQGPRNGARATTTVTRTDDSGDCFQAGVIDWPVRLHDRARVVVGTRTVPMSKTGIFTSPERFIAADGDPYEWQIQDARPQLVPLRANRATTSHVARYVQSESRFLLWRRRTTSLFIPPEGREILDDIVVTFIYFESRWRDKEDNRSRFSLSGPII